jgi:hypothetical protein
MATSRAKSGTEQGKDSMDYFFFLVSFLVVIIFTIAPLYLTVFSKLNPTNTGSLVSFENQLDNFAKIIVPLVIFGAVLGYLGTGVQLSKTRTLRLSSIVFLVAFLVELYFVWVYVYL